MHDNNHKFYCTKSIENQMLQIKIVIMNSAVKGLDEIVILLSFFISKISGWFFVSEKPPMGILKNTKGKEKFVLCLIKAFDYYLS